MDITYATLLIHITGQFTTTMRRALTISIIWNLPRSLNNYIGDTNNVPNSYNMQKLLKNVSFLKGYCL